MKKLLLMLLCILLTPLGHTESIQLYIPTIQIYTHFKDIIGQPSWLLELRDENTGQVLPYVYDIKHQDNFFLALSAGHNYRVIASIMQFNPFVAKIHNFCHLENGILSGISMYITLTGDLTPDRKTVQCHVAKYKDAPFNIGIGAS